MSVKKSLAQGSITPSRVRIVMHVRLLFLCSRAGREVERLLRARYGDIGVAYADRRVRAG